MGSPRGGPYPDTSVELVYRVRIRKDATWNSRGPVFAAFVTPLMAQHRRRRAPGLDNDVARQFDEGHQRTRRPKSHFRFLEPNMRVVRTQSWYFSSNDAHFGVVMAGDTGVRCEAKRVVRIVCGAMKYRYILPVSASGPSAWRGIGRSGWSAKRGPLSAKGGIGAENGRLSPFRHVAEKTWPRIVPPLGASCCLIKAFISRQDPGCKPACPPLDGWLLPRMTNSYF